MEPSRGEREGENKRGGGYAERATFHEGLEHFVKYYVFTKKKGQSAMVNFIGFVSNKQRLDIFTQKHFC